MEKLKDYPFENVENGKANDINEFFDLLIKEQFKRKEGIKTLHRTIIDYLKFDNHTLFLRLYGSYNRKDSNSLRRGFLTEYPDNSRMAFCDNTFSMLFTGLKLSGIKIDPITLKDFLNQKKVICSFILTKQERELAYYVTQNALGINLNSKGWYLAHIKPVGYGYGEITSIQKHFPNPERSEWDEKEKTRKVQQNLDETQKKLLKAQFIRLVHPLNSFLVPKQKHLCYSGKNIGEETELLILVRNYLKTEFKDEYLEFDELSETYDFQKSVNKISDISWFANPLHKNKQNSVKKNKSIKTELDINDKNSLGIELNKWMNSIGKEAFLNLYSYVEENIDVDESTILKTYPQYKDSIKTRLPSTKSIFRNGLQAEALVIIIDSNRDDLREKAKKYYLDSQS